MSELVDETLEICVPVSQHGYELIGFLVDHLDALIEEWYPGLSKHNSVSFFIDRLAVTPNHLRSEHLA